MQEFTIKVICNGGTPYFLHNYKTFNDAYVHLLDMISLEEERGRQYYVDNSFFKNKYQYVGKLKYFKIFVRDVSEWFDYDFYNKENFKNDTNLIYFNNFLKNSCNK